MDLLLDIKILIASFDIDVWVKLAIYDDEFKQFACSAISVKQFIKLFTMCEISSGVRRYTLFNKLHRLDGPAVIKPCGSQIWYRNDFVHREEGPAVIFANGLIYWVQNNKYHIDESLRIIKGSGC